MPLLCWNTPSCCMSSLFVQSIFRTGKYPWGCARSAPSHICACLPGDHTWNLAYMTRRINIAAAKCKLPCVIYIMFFVHLFIFQKAIKLWTNDRLIGHKNPLATHPKRLIVSAFHLCWLRYTTFICRNVQSCVFLTHMSQCQLTHILFYFYTVLETKHVT